MNEEIQQILKTEGWKAIKQVFIDRAEGSISNIDTSNNYENIAVEYIGKREAQRIVLEAIAELERMGGLKESEPQSYK